MLIGKKLLLSSQFIFHFLQIIVFIKNAFVLPEKLGVQTLKLQRKIYNQYADYNKSSSRYENKIAEGS
jgi:hypothetical protein